MPRTRDVQSMPVWERSLVYGVAGVAGEVVFTAVADFFKGRDRRLIGRSSLWMVPVYALMEPLFDPASEWMRRNLPIVVRLPLYALGFMAAERTAAVAICRLGGDVPWDYSHSKWSRCDGTIRLDYLPVWMTLGLIMERLAVAQSSTHVSG